MISLKDTTACLHHDRNALDAAIRWPTAVWSQRCSVRRATLLPQAMCNESVFGKPWEVVSFSFERNRIRGLGKRCVMMQTGIRLRGRNVAITATYYAQFATGPGSPLLFVPTVARIPRQETRRLEKFWGQMEKATKPGRPSRLSQTGRSNDNACVRRELSTACCPDLSTFPPNASALSRREKEGKRG